MKPFINRNARPGQAPATGSQQPMRPVQNNNGPTLRIPPQHRAVQPTQSMPQANRPVHTGRGPEPVRINPVNSTALAAAEYNPENIEVNLMAANFFSVPAMHPMHYRPMEVAANTNRAINRLQEVTQGGNLIDHHALSNLAASLIRPSRQSRGVIAIDGDWNQKRFAFYLLFQIRTPFSVSMEVVTGFTDHDGYSELQGPNSGVWDERMVLHINTHMTVSTQKIENGGVRGFSYQVSDASQILQPITVVRGNTQQTGKGNTSLRPGDALARLTVLKTPDSNPLTTFDLRTQISQPSPAGDGYIGTASNRSNESPSRYLARILGSYRTALADTYGAGDEVALYGYANSYATDRSLANSALMNKLSSNTIYGASGVVTYGELRRLFPNINSVDEVFLPPRGKIVSLTENTNQWGAANFATQICYALSHIVPSTLSSHLGNTASFIVTNRTASQQTEVALTDFRPMFDCVNDQIFGENFRLALQNDVFPEIMSEPVPFEIRMNCEIFGISRIHVEIGGQDYGDFSAPNYADGLTSSNIALGDDQLDQLAMTTEGIINNTFQHKNQFMSVGFQKG